MMRVRTVRYKRNSFPCVVRLALLTALVVMVAGAVTADERASLIQLRQVSLSVEIAHPLPTMTVEDLTTRLETALRESQPPLTIREGLTDRIRVIVSVRPMSATTLRGFWLPFSGTYGVGVVRLAVERLVNLPGTSRPVLAIVWQAERTVGSSWHVTDGEIARLVDDLVAEMVDARRQRVP
jgi:hypothetical protein